MSNAAEKTGVTIQLKKSTYGTASVSGTVLPIAEPLFITDKNYLVIGDGATAVKDLISTNKFYTVSNDISSAILSARNIKKSGETSAVVGYPLLTIDSSNTITIKYSSDTEPVKLNVDASIIKAIINNGLEVNTQTTGDNTKKIATTEFVNNEIEYKKNIYNSGESANPIYPALIINDDNTLSIKKSLTEESIPMPVDSDKVSDAVNSLTELKINSKKVATEDYVGTEIGKLNVNTLTLSNNQTIKTISETNGKISATTQNIKLTKSNITDLDMNTEFSSRASTTAPSVNKASASIGTSNNYARADHIHPRIKPTQLSTATGIRTPVICYLNDNDDRGYYYSIDVYIEDNVLYGAGWNDFAEFRECDSIEEAGTVVCDSNSGKLKSSREFMQACPYVISDTYGYVLGDRNLMSVPVAVAGRVLVKISGDLSSYHVGDIVCAGKDGRACKMSRRLARRNPDRILGYVSEIPDYEEWNAVKVNGRIWVRIK